MSNRQSNIIFYSIILFVLSAVIVNINDPSFFYVFTKSKEERLIIKSMNNKEYKIALDNYEILVKKQITDNSENSLETAIMYEKIANIYFLLGNKKEEKKYYFQSLDIKKKLKKVDLFRLANTYFKLGSIFEEESEYDQAQKYFEKALVTRLGDLTEIDEDDGMFISMQKSRLIYLRLNHTDTIDTFKKLANIHYIKREYSIAKEYYEKALSASILTFGEDDIRTLEIRNNDLSKANNLR
jgi:tetratricopeptide (TPR) repeat protein